jgi:hypothetical protein
MVWHQRRSAIALLEREQRSPREVKQDSGRWSAITFLQNQKLAHEEFRKRRIENWVREETL